MEEKRKRKEEEEKKVNLFLYLRLFIILILPLLIYLYLFSSFNYPFVNKGNGLMVLEEKCPSLSCSLRQILDIPFKSDYYNMCFVDNGGSSPYPYEILLENGNNSTAVNITGKGKFCEVIDLRLGVKTYTELASGSLNLGGFEENSTLVLNLESRVWTPSLSPDKWSGRVKLLLTYLAIWAIILLVKEIYLFAKSGFRR